MAEQRIGWRAFGTALGTDQLDPPTGAGPAIATPVIGPSRGHDDKDAPVHDPLNQLYPRSLRNLRRRRLVTETLVTKLGPPSFVGARILNGQPNFRVRISSESLNAIRACGRRAVGMFMLS